MINFQKRKWKSIYGFFQKNQFRVISVFVIGIISNVLTVLIPISLGKYFDLTFGFQSHRAAFLDRLPFSFWNDMNSYLTYMTVLVLLGFVFHFMQRFQTGILGEKFVKNLREELFSKQLKIKSEVYSTRGTGRYLLRHSGDLKSIQNYLTKGIIRFSTDIILIGLTLIVLFFLNSLIFFTLGVGLVVTILGVFFLNKLLFKISVNRRNTRSGMLSFVNNQLRAIQTVKVFNKTFTEEKKYLRRSEKLVNIGIEFQKIYNLIFTIVPTFFYLTLVAILFVVHHQSKSTNNVEPQNMLAVIFLLITILPVLRRVIRVSTTLELGDISFEKLINVFELEADDNASSLPNFEFKNGQIEFQDVDFAYPNLTPIFSNLNFKINARQVNHIELGNGNGKSTLIKLMSGLFSPSTGSILVDDQNIQQVNTKSYLKKITFVSSEFPLIGKNVFEAVAYSRKEKNRKKAQSFLEIFQKNTPKKFRLKLEDRIVDGGKNLSKAQVKMLFYVRAAMTNKPILVIENPMQGLESHARKNILKWLKSLEGKNTIILICKNWRSNSVQIDHPIKVDYLEKISPEYLAH